MRDNYTIPQSEMSMNSLLEEYSYERPKRGQFRDAEIMQIDSDRILLDLGGKIDAVVTPREFKNTDQEILDSISEGDTVPVYVLNSPRVLQKPSVSLQRGLEKLDWDRAKDFMENEKLAKVKVSAKNKGGMLVKFGKLTGFLPASLLPVISRAPSRKLSETIKRNLIGEELTLSIIEVNPKRRRLIFSGRIHQDRIQKKFFDEAREGDVRMGIVVNVVEYGAFVDLFGAVGLLHVSEIGWLKIDKPSDVLNIGDKLEVKILQVNSAEEKISLSRKALIDPFQDPALEPVSG